jgi:hypothetical protein
MWVEKQNGLSWADAKALLDAGGFVNIIGWNAEWDRHETALESVDGVLTVVSRPKRSILTPGEGAIGVKLADLETQRQRHGWNPSPQEIAWPDWRELEWVED